MKEDQQQVRECKGAGILVSAAPDLIGCITTAVADSVHPARLLDDNSLIEENQSEWS